MAEDQVLHFKIQPPRSVVRDVLRNKYWIISSSIVVCIVTVVSALLFQWFERGQKLGLVDCFYFTVINLTTVGFGDIHPKSDAGKILAVANSVFGVVLFGFIVSVITAALQPSSYKGEGLIEHSGDARKPDAESQTSRPETTTTSSLELSRFLESLNALIAKNQSGQMKPRVRLAAGSLDDRNVVIGIDIFVQARND